MAGTPKVGRVSPELMRKATELANKTGVSKWVPKFWNAISKGKTKEAGNFFKTIVHIVRNNSNKLITSELEAAIPEMEAALGELGVDIAGETIAGELGAGAAMGGSFLGITPLGWAIIAVIIIACAVAAHGEELPPPPRQVPPPYRGNTELDPAAMLQLELMIQRMARNHRPERAGH